MFSRSGANRTDQEEEGEGLEVLEHPELSVGDAGDLPPVSLRVVVKVPGVAVVADLGHDGRLQLLVIHLLPVHALEPPANMFWITKYF